MPHLNGLSQWQQTVSTHLPHLSRPQRLVLALWSVGIVLAQSCGLTSVAVLLAYLLDRSEAALREQLRDWCRDARHKRGAKQGCKRRDLEVHTCFAPLLRWVVSLMPSSCRQIALAMDASTLGQRFTLLSLHVVICGCAIPVAWHMVEATRAGAWRPHWEALFGHLQGAVPDDWTVIVLADRGLWAKWLFQTITALGWHPLLRINRQGQYRPVSSPTFRPLSQVVHKGGPGWAGQVICFATKEPYVLSYPWTDRSRKPVANQRAVGGLTDGTHTHRPPGDHERAPLHRDPDPAGQLYGRREARHSRRVRVV